MSKKHKGSGRKKPKGVEHLIHRIEQVEARLAALEGTRRIEPLFDEAPRPGNEERPPSVFDRFPDGWLEYD